MTRGRALAAWVIPCGFEAQLINENGQPSPVQLIVDGSDVMSAQTAVATAGGLAASYGHSVQPVMAVSLGYVLFLLMLALVVLVFDVPMRGSLPLLMGLALFYMIVELGWGLMISAVAKTQMQALLLAFALVMVMIIFSGYAFPVDTMPPFLQTISNFFPLKHWLIIFRSILLKGAGLQEFWPEVLAIFVLGIALYTITIFLLRQNKLE